MKIIYVERLNYLGCLQCKIENSTFRGGKSINYISNRYFKVTRNKTNATVSLGQFESVATFSIYEIS